MMKHQEYKKPVIQSTRTEQVVFKDGMIVTAEHLQAAMQYPVSLFQTLVRSFFGCGIVCGLKVEAVDGCTTCEADDTRKNVWEVQILSGVALDCQGYPLELCKPIKINLKPDPCSCDGPPAEVCIAIRRYVSEDLQTKSSCNGSESEQVHDPRKPEQIMIKVFEINQLKGLQLPENTCLRELPAVNPQNNKRTSEQEHAILCDCLKTCPEHQCCGEGWVLLACIELDKCGITVIDNSQRKYIKPIDCMCPPEDIINVNVQNKPEINKKPDPTHVAIKQTPGKSKQGEQSK
jgi:hypothetical protein